MADIGWITGHTYVVYGPLANGGTSILFESMPNYPDPGTATSHFCIVLTIFRVFDYFNYSATSFLPVVGRYWETVERLRINQFYGSPTAYRLLMRYSNNHIKKYDLSSLRVVGSGKICFKLFEMVVFLNIFFSWRTYQSRSLELVE